MMTGLEPQVTRSVASIASETASSKAESTLHSVRFWKACQAGTAPNDALRAAGFEVEFEPSPDRSVQQVTLRLNPTWMSILQRVLDRRTKS